MPPKTNAFKAKLPAFHRSLHRWYGEHGRRALPWRNTRDAYRIYVSEIMLQQTQVKTVLERYWQPFLKCFPTLRALADADGQAVVKAWEGLGYYNRAANLHAAAQQCKGRLPQTVEALMALPGIGRNTAHAVACFAFGTAMPVMEANVRRVLCRVFALRRADEATLWKKAADLLDRKNPFDYNQAMMDVGSLVCTRRAPRCGLCPLSLICRGKASPASYPAPKERVQAPVRKRVIVVFSDGKDRYHLSKRTTRFLQGLYGFMEYDGDAKTIEFKGKTHRLGAHQLLGAVTQSYSHFTLDAIVYLVRLEGLGGTASLQEIKALPLSRADHKVVQLLAAAGTTARGPGTCPGQ